MGNREEGKEYAKLRWRWAPTIRPGKKMMTGRADRERERVWCACVAEDEELRLKMGLRVGLGYGVFYWALIFYEWAGIKLLIGLLINSTLD